MLTLQNLRYKAAFQIPATLITLFLMWLLPLLVHLLPLAGPTPPGAIFLPIFYAPLLAAWLFHPLAGLVASLLMPFINFALTGSPALPMAVLLSLELVVFSLALQGLKRRWPRLFFNAPLAFVLGKVVSALLLLIVPVLPVPPLAYLASSIFNAWPGLLILLGLNFAILRIPHS